MSMNRLAFAERRSAGRTLPRFAALAGLLCFSFHAQSVRAATEWYDGITAAVDKSLTPEGRGAPRPVKFRFELREKDLTFTAPDGKFTVPLDGKPVPSAATAYCNGKPTNLRRSWSANAFFYVEPGRPWGTPLTRLAFQRSSDLSFPTGSPCAGKDSLVENLAALSDAGGLDDDSPTTLSSFFKGRGIGDCGEEASWTWTGGAFRLNSYITLPECRGVASDDWITLFRSTDK